MPNQLKMTAKIAVPLYEIQEEKNYSKDRILKKFGYQ